MVPVEKLIEQFQTMYRQHWPYVWGSSEDGCVDCSGAFVNAFRKFGIYYPHGSNAIARNYTVGGMLPISQAKPGMAAFKVREPGEDGYALPDKYKNGSDLNDYYHIGLVDNDTRYVLNAKGEKSGFSRDQLTARNGWDCVAYLKDVQYQEEIEMTQARVVLPTGATGNTVNLRKTASTGSAIIERVPVGSVVDVITDSGQWCKIEYDGKVGYMMSNYLEYEGQADETETLTEDQLDQIRAALTTIENACDLISSIVGRG